MPQPLPSVSELRLASFGRFFAIVYFALALLVAAAPHLVWKAATLGGDAFSALSESALFWSTSAAALMVALGTSCLVVSARPRERRHAMLPVAAALFTSSALAALHLAGASGLLRRAFFALLLVDAPVFLLTVLVYRAAATGVHSAPARELPPPPEPAKANVQLGSSAPK